LQTFSPPHCAWHLTAKCQTNQRLSLCRSYTAASSPPAVLGKNPRRFEEKYKERDPQPMPKPSRNCRCWQNPCGHASPNNGGEILEVLAPRPGEVAVGLHTRLGGHAQELLAGFNRVADCWDLDADPIELPKTKPGCAPLGLAPKFSPRTAQQLSLACRKF